MIMTEIVTRYSPNESKTISGQEIFHHHHHLILLAWIVDSQGVVLAISNAFP
jgi:hypothetical protein